MIVEQVAVTGVTGGWEGGGIAKRPARAQTLAFSAASSQVPGTAMAQQKRLTTRLSSSGWGRCSAPQRNERREGSMKPEVAVHAALTIDNWS